MGIDFAGVRYSGGRLILLKLLIGGHLAREEVPANGHQGRDFPRRTAHVLPITPEGRTIPGQGRPNARDKQADPDHGRAMIYLCLLKRELRLRPDTGPSRQGSPCVSSCRIMINGTESTAPRSWTEFFNRDR